jgi:SMI1/KNR4 family protein SUKH-1
VRLAEVLAYGAALERVAASQGADYRLRTSPGATPEAIARCERSIGYTLSASLRELLADSDGLHAAFFRPEARSGSLGFAWITVFDTATIAEASADLNDFARAIDESLGVTLPPRRFVEIAAVDDERVMLNPYRSEAGSEFAVAVVDEAEGTWVRAGDTLLVAPRFDVFLRSALVSAHSSERGFAYWTQRDIWAGGG